LFALLFALAGHAEDPPVAPKPTTDKDRLGERSRLWQELKQHLKAGKLPEAIQDAERMLAVERQLPGADRDVASTLNLLADLQVRKGDFARAREWGKQALDLRLKVGGERDWQTTDARRKLAEIDVQAKLEPDQRQRLADVDRAQEKASALYGKRQYKEAAELLEQVLAARARELGPGHPSCLSVLADLAAVAQQLGQPKKVEDYRRRAADLARQTYGEDHPEYADRLNRLGLFYIAEGRLPDAEAPLTQALTIRRRALGEDHADFATSLNNLAVLAKRRGQFDRAEQLYRQAMAIVRRNSQEETASFAIDLQNLGLLLLARADRARKDLDESETLLRRALALRRRFLGADHAETRDTRQGLVQLYDKQFTDVLQNPPTEGLPKEPERLRRLAAICERQVALLEEDANFQAAQGVWKALVVLRTRLHGKDNWRTAEARVAQQDAERQAQLSKEARQKLADADKLVRQGRERLEAGKPAEARAPLEKARALRAEVLGAEHPQVADALHVLAIAHFRGNEAEAAGELWREAARLWQAAYGRDHPRLGDFLGNRAAVARSRGDQAQAAELLREAHRIKVVALGEESLEAQRTFDAWCDTLEGWARQALRRGDAEGMKVARDQLVEVRTRRLGKDHWQTVEARAFRAELDQLAKLTPKQREWLLGVADQEDAIRALQQKGQVEKAAALARQQGEQIRTLLGEGHYLVAENLRLQAELSSAQGEPARAEELLRAALTNLRATFGPSHPEGAAILDRIGASLRQRGDLAGAEAAYREGLQTMRAAVGPRGVRTAALLNSLADVRRERGDSTEAGRLYREASEILQGAPQGYETDLANTLSGLANLHADAGDLAEAEKLYRRALDLDRQARGPGHVETTAHANNLALVLRSRGKYAEAEPLLRQALEVRRAQFGADHVHVAAALMNLALVREDLGDAEQARQLWREAAAIWRKHNPRHPAHATVLTNLGLQAGESGDAAEAERCLREALEVRRQAHGDKHRDYAVALKNFARVQIEAGKAAEAERLLTEAERILRAAVGDAHPDYADLLRAQATAADRAGKAERAGELLGRALEIYRRVLGPDHETTLTTLLALAKWQASRGERPRAVALLEEGLLHSARNLERAADVQAERLQIEAALKLRAMQYLYLSVAPFNEKTLATVYEQVLRWKGAVAHRQYTLRALRSRLDPGGRALVTQLEAVTARLATISLAGTPDGKGEGTQQFRELNRRKEELEAELARRSASFRPDTAVTPARLAQALPPGVVLIDFLDWARFTPTREGMDVWAVENRVLAFVARAGQPVRAVDLGPSIPVGQALARWRTALHRRAGGANDPGQELRRRLWEPLEPLLAGADTVLVSPDRELAQLPFGALPGRKPQTYLIEDYALAVAPAPQLLPALLAASAGSGDGGTLLAVGEVDFDAGGSSVAVATRAPGVQFFAPLPGTRGEVLAVAELYERSAARRTAELLRGPRATKESLRQRAPGARWLHLATHGYFVAEHGDRIPAGLLAGLAFAGANRPTPAEQAAGILTAAEVAEVDLHRVELAVLSACETGLGKVENGEGLLGLQRAFQIAGARTVVASLWQVPDEPTRALMEQFYHNLWQKKMPKLAAFRAAQLWMLREGRRDGSVQRGMQRLDAGEPATADTGRLPPYFWAAFVLAGDWR
jgi:CHAT domain-containing protein/Tfp pilus assembly protein PilF